MRASLAQAFLAGAKVALAGVGHGVRRQAVDRARLPRERLSALLRDAQIASRIAAVVAVCVGLDGEPIVTRIHFLRTLATIRLPVVEAVALLFKVHDSSRRILLPHLALGVLRQLHALRAVSGGVDGAVRRFPIEAVLLLQALLVHRRGQRDRRMPDRVHLVVEASRARAQAVRAGKARRLRVVLLALVLACIRPHDLRRVEAAADLLSRLLLHGARRRALAGLRFFICAEPAQDLITVALVVVDIEDVTRPEFRLALLLLRALARREDVNVELVDVFERHGLVLEHLLDGQRVATAAAVERLALDRTTDASKFIVDMRHRGDWRFVSVLLAFGVRKFLLNYRGDW